MSKSYYKDINRLKQSRSTKKQRFLAAVAATSLIFSLGLKYYQFEEHIRSLEEEKQEIEQEIKYLQELKSERDNVKDQYKECIKQFVDNFNFDYFSREEFISLLCMWFSCTYDENGYEINPEVLGSTVLYDEGGVCRHKAQIMCDILNAKEPNSAKYDSISELDHAAVLWKYDPNSTDYDVLIDPTHGDIFSFDNTPYKTTNEQNVMLKYKKYYPEKFNDLSSTVTIADFQMFITLLQIGEKATFDAKKLKELSESYNKQNSDFLDAASKYPQIDYDYEKNVAYVTENHPIASVWIALSDYFTKNPNPKPGETVTLTRNKSLGISIVDDKSQDR